MVIGNCNFRKGGGDGEKEEEERLLKRLVTITNRKCREVLVLVDALYLDASFNDKVETMTVHQANDTVAGRLGLVKLKKSGRRPSKNG
jgi:hypothetical protein